MRETMKAVSARRKRETDKHFCTITVRRKGSRQRTYCWSNESRAAERSAMSRHLYYYHSSHTVSLNVLYSRSDMFDSDINSAGLRTGSA